MNKITIECETCKKTFSVWPYEIDPHGKRRPRKYCSFKCRPHKRWPEMTAIERFMSKIDFENGIEPSHCHGIGKCWTYTGSKSKFGYGQFCNTDGKPILAHRYMWQITYGSEIFENILHKCDNPACVRPSHLFQGTKKDNAHDCIAKHRFPFRPKGVPRTTKLNILK